MRLIDAEKMIIKIPAELPARQRLRILNIIRESIEQVPTVDAELVKHRHWINMGEHTGADGYTWGKIYCSGCEMGFIGMGTIDTEALHYCPNCGRKMDEEADDE